MAFTKLAVASVLLLASLVSAKVAVTPSFPDAPSQPLQMRARPPPVVAAGSTATSGQATFEQILDHTNKTSGTFSQTYWWSTKYCSGPGCPVVLFTPGESNASHYTGYLTNDTLTGQFAQAIGGATILLEHRYWGTSSPYDDLSTKNLQYLTLDNAIHDLNNFANTVDLPFDTNGSSNAANAPWVLSGGSYSGALAAWTASIAPGTFWAYHSTSAPVEAIYDYWSYFQPIQLGMASNCSRDLSKVIDYIDSVLESGSAQEKDNLKDKFGLASVEHDDDFAAAIENGPWLWQSNQFYEPSQFFQMCDAIENAGAFSNVSASNWTKSARDSSSVSHDPISTGAALEGLATWFRTDFLPGWCAGYGYADWQGEYNTLCFDTYNSSSPMYTDASLSNTFDRQWQWFLCNEPFGYWQDGAPDGTASLVSRLVTGDYWQRQCALFFPDEDGYTFGYASGKRASDVNEHTKGWDFTGTDRFLWVNGQFDPWRAASVSADSRPQGPLNSTVKNPIEIIPGGFHCSDLLLENGEVNAGVASVQQKAIAQIAAWVKEWPGKTGNATGTAPGYGAPRVHGGPATLRV